MTLRLPPLPPMSRLLFLSSLLRELYLWADLFSDSFPLIEACLSLLLTASSRRLSCKEVGRTFHLQVFLSPSDGYLSSLNPCYCRKLHHSLLTVTVAGESSICAKSVWLVSWWMWLVEHYLSDKDSLIPLGGKNIFFCRSVFIPLLTSPTCLLCSLSLSLPPLVSWDPSSIRLNTFSKPSTPPHPLAPESLTHHYFGFMGWMSSVSFMHPFQE